ncbi:MAG: alcohol dehydrogenase catalytic domain-containing protein [Candidatus Bathyarchaeota archaeon]|nr:MAG: alcohol dehydrogenase catalytic domain-containing protein [Candidatus Bathyarchaeota archaeon]
MPIPEIGAGELLLKVSMCGICGSDVMEWYRIQKAPRVLGHEVVGVISEVGEGVDQYSPGERVFISHHVPCGECRYCQTGRHTACETLHSTNLDPGGFAEYTRVPGINVERGVFLLPDEVTDEEGVFVEPLGCVLRGQEKLGIREGDTVLVLGSGVSGILHIQLARSLGASLVLATDINESRLRFAELFGAHRAIEASEDVPGIVREVNEGNLTDHVVVSTAALPAIRQAFECVDDGGNILIFAPTPPGVELSLEINDLWNRQVTVTTTYAASPSDLEIALELIRAGQVRVGEMVTDRLGLAETSRGFRMVAEPGESLKVVVEPHR